MLHQICHHDPLQIYQVKKSSKILKRRKISRRTGNGSIDARLIKSSIKTSNKEKKKKKNKRSRSKWRTHWPRFDSLLSRLTPAYLFVLGINEIVMKHRVPRSVFTPAAIDHFTCEKFWWRNALYLNSLYPRSEMVRILKLNVSTFMKLSGF